MIFFRKNSVFSKISHFREISEFSFVFHEGNGVAQTRPEPTPAGRRFSPTFYLGILDFPDFADSGVALTHTPAGVPAGKNGWDTLRAL